MCIYHAWSFSLMIIESKFAVNCHHFIPLQKCNKNNFMVGKLHCFFRNIFRWCLTFDAVYISATSGPITMKFYQKHHWNERKAAFGFRLLWFTWQQKAPIGLKWRKRCCHFFSADLHPILFILPGNDDMHVSSEEFGIQLDPTTDCGVSCP